MPTTVTGTPNSDFLSGEEAAEVFEGYEGDDIIYGTLAPISPADGNDTVFGGSGHDFIIGAGSHDVLYGEDGNDTVNGQDGDDLIEGGDGDDNLNGDEGNDSAYGGAGFDFIQGVGGNDLLSDSAGGVQMYGGADNDYLYLGGTSGSMDPSILHGGDGDDTIEIAQGLLLTVDGAAGNDTLLFDDIDLGVVVSVTPVGQAISRSVISNAANVVQGVFENVEVIRGSSAPDTFTITTNDPTITRLDGRGNVLMLPDSDPDSSVGDTLISHATSVSLADGELHLPGRVDAISVVNFENFTTVNDSGADIEGSSVANFIIGAAGADTIRGLGGDDTIIAYAGNDSINAGGGNDVIVAGTGVNTVDGGDGNDLLEFSLSLASYDLTVAENGDVTLARDGESTTASQVEDFNFAGAVMTYDQLLATLNAEPSIVTITQATVTENQTGRVIATLSAADADLDTLTFRIVDAVREPVDSEIYEIVGNQLRVKAGVEIDFEAGLPAVAIAAFDGSATGMIQVLTPTIVDVAESITVALEFTDRGIGETLVTGSNGSDNFDGSLATTGVNFDGGAGDDLLGGGSFNDTLLGGAGNDLLGAGLGVNVVNGGEGSDLAFFAPLFASDDPLAPFSFARDGDAIIVTHLGEDGSTAGTTRVTNVETFGFLTGFGAEFRSYEMILELANSAPGTPEATLVVPTVAENAAAGTVVATMSATDADGDELTYSFATEEGVALYNSAFEIVGNELRVVDPASLLPPPPFTPIVALNGLDYETDTSISFYIIASDGVGTSSLSQEITIQLSDIAERVSFAHHVDPINYVERGVAELEVTGTVFGDTLEGGDESDTFFGAGGSDVLLGRGGNDTLNGGRGADVLDGGAGIDAVSYSKAGQGVTVNLDTGSAMEGNQIDVLIDVEDAFGSQHDDIIYGNSQSNELLGRDGNDDLLGGGGADRLSGGTGNDNLLGEAGSDRLNGGAGADQLIGGLGRDFLTGGEGVDVFLFNTLSESRVGTRDVITSFEHGTDMLDLSGIDANALRGGNQAFVLSETGRFSGTAGELIINARGVVGDVDGDGRGDFAVAIRTVVGGALDAGDFLL